MKKGLLLYRVRTYRGDIAIFQGVEFPVNIHPRFTEPQLACANSTEPFAGSTSHTLLLYLILRFQLLIQ